MGDVIRFDPKRRPSRKWTRPEDYGGGPEPPRPPKKPKRGSLGWRRALSGWRFWLLLVTLIAAWVLLGDPRLAEPPAFLQTEPETVSGSFTRCPRGRDPYCVVDGDTFRIGDRSIRVTGIDAPEAEGACDAEVQGAGRAAAALQAWLNRGPFEMTARIGDPTDQYGREVRIVRRVGKDGAVDRLADHMVSGGFARPYRIGGRSGWC